MELSFYHGGIMTVVDGIGMNPLYGIMSRDSDLISKCIQKLTSMISSDIHQDSLNES